MTEQQVPKDGRATAGTAASQEVRLPAAHTLVLPDDRRAVAVFAPATVSGDDAVTALSLPRPKGVVVLNGGTAELPVDLAAALRRNLGQGLARLVADEGITVVTGGTDAGIFALFGQALDDSLTAPCIGVVPTGRIDWPGRDPPGDSAVRSEQPVPLEPHHSHFLLIAGDEWGVETDAMLSFTGALAAGCESIAVVAGGGSGARQEVHGHLAAGREIIVLAGSGRLADELAGVIASGGASDPAMAHVAATGLVNVVDVAEPPSVLANLVRERLYLKK
jgi:hypothetical protein